jgi:ribonucleoside-diphosphate reductase alpha chain
MGSKAREREEKCMKFERLLSIDGGEKDAESLRWEKRIVQVQVGDGTSAAEEVEVVVPAAWSDRAASIAAGKYMRRTVGKTVHCPEPSPHRETHMGAVVKRIVDAIAMDGVRRGYFGKADVNSSLNDNARVFRDELSLVLLRQFAAFNSPVWFNCGLFEAYGAYSYSSNYAWSDADGYAVKVKNAYERPQCSACFIQSVDDSIESIYELIKTEARLFKHGSGTGTNFSTIRGKDEPLSGGGRSSGLMSFLDAYDAAAGALKSGGVTRRAAKMTCLDLDHPEIGEFITWKMREEKKARALIAAGYSSDFEGEAYRTVGGQNSNVSVRVHDGFMRVLFDAQHAPAAYPDSLLKTTLRTTGEPFKYLEPTKLWDMICVGAWECGDPGIQFSDTIESWNVVPSCGKIRASNPCSEFLFIDDSACNLASINLAKVFAASPAGAVACSGIEFFEHIVRLLITAQDILVDYGSYPTVSIAENSHKFRPLGLGYADLGGWLMANGIPYDSHEGRALAASVTSLMTAAAYRTSREIANVVGPGPWLVGNEHKCDLARVIRKHAEAHVEVRGSMLNRLAGASAHAPRTFFDRAGQLWHSLRDEGSALAVRNAQVTVLAPTGTIGLLMDCDATGVEPVYALLTHKALAGGGSMTIPCNAAKAALSRLLFRSPACIKEAALDHVAREGTIVGAGLVPDSWYSIFDTADEAGGRCVDSDGHLLMVAAVQPFLSGGISKTINLPNNTTVEDIGRIYERAWRLGVKSITVYRNESKASQPLRSRKRAQRKNATQASEVAQVADSAKALARGERERVPRVRYGITFSCKIDGVDVDFRTGTYEDGRLCELYIDGYRSGHLRSIFDGFAVAVSLGLQYGVPLEAYVRQFESMHFAPSGFVTDHPFIKTATSPYDLIVRTLDKVYPGGRENADVAALLNTSGRAGNGRTFAPAQSEAPKAAPVPERANNAHRAARMCRECGGAMLPTGSCYTCAVCGANTGCG